MANRKVKKRTSKYKKLTETGPETGAEAAVLGNDVDTYQDILERAVSSGTYTLDLIRRTRPELLQGYTKWRNDCTMPLPPQSNLQFWNRVHQTTFGGQVGLYNYLEQCCFETILLGTYGGQQLRLELAVEPFEIMNNNNAIAVQLLYIDALDTQENKAGEVLCCQPIGWLLVNAGDSWVRTGHVVLLDSDKVDKKEPWIVLAKEWQKTPCNEYCACDRGCDSTHEGEEDSSQPEQAPDIADVSTTSHTPEQGSLPGDLIYTTVTKLIFPEIDDLLQYGEPQDICLQNHGQRWHNNHLQTCLAKLHG